MTANGTVFERASFLVTVEDGGVIGRGEATPLPELGGESFEVAERELAHLERGVSSPAVRFAVEHALLDLLSQREQRPIAALLSESSAREVRVNALADSPEQAKAAVARGFDTIKVKVGTRSPAEEITNVRSIREAVGPEVKVRVDANGAWSFPVARELLRSFGAMQLECCEQPTRELDDLERLRAAGVPIALDEGLLGLLRPLPPFVPSLDTVLHAPSAPDLGRLRELCDVVVLKPALLGGLVRCLQIARLAAEQGVAAFVTAGYEGAIGRSGAAHLAAALPAQTHAHGLGTGELFGELVTPTIRIGAS